jgi:Uncharacterized conserved protein
MSEEKEDLDKKYESFLQKLKDGHSFPGNYMFKFIVPSDHQKLANLQRLFDDARPQFQMKSSKNGKYTSLTTIIYAMDAEEVVAYYKEASKIDNVILM